MRKIEHFPPFVYPFCIIEIILIPSKDCRSKPPTNATSATTVHQSLGCTPVRAQICLEEISGTMSGQSTQGKVNDLPDSLNTEAWALYIHLEMIRLSGLMWSTRGWLC